MLATVSQWIARLSSIVVLAFILLSATVPAASPTNKQLVALIFFPGLVGVGLILAWWREDLGAIVATAGLAGFYAWNAISGAHFARGPWFVICWAPTLFFAASWLLRHKD
jgi:hypothetical protein